MRLEVGPRRGRLLGDPQLSLEPARCRAGDGEEEEPRLALLVLQPGLPLGVVAAPAAQLLAAADDAEDNAEMQHVARAAAQPALPVDGDPALLGERHRLEELVKAEEADLGRRADHRADLRHSAQTSSTRFFFSRPQLRQWCDPLPRGLPESWNSMASRRRMATGIGEQSRAGMRRRSASFCEPRLTTRRLIAGAR